MQDAGSLFGARIAHISSTDRGDLTNCYVRVRLNFDAILNNIDDIKPCEGQLNSSQDHKSLRYDSMIKTLKLDND